MGTHLISLVFLVFLMSLILSNYQYLLLNLIEDVSKV